MDEIQLDGGGFTRGGERIGHLSDLVALDFFKSENQVEFKVEKLQNIPTAYHEIARSMKEVHPGVNQQRIVDIILQYSFHMLDNFFRHRKVKSLFLSTKQLEIIKK